MARKTKKSAKSVETLTHGDATRTNIPTAEHQSVMKQEEQDPVRVAYERRNRDLDPQLVWRGKDEQDWSDLVVQAPPLYIQEKVHPKVLVDDLLRRTEADEKAADPQPDLFADFGGLPDENATTEFYQHDANWTNRMILGDSLQVMASMAEREGLRGKVQCIYLDPPYGIKFNSNFQWSTTSRDVKDGKADHITREPEQVKAFRDTWRDGIHSYLTYLRDRLTVARDLLADSGSIFVQIGDENVHRVRTLMDEVFGEDNFVASVLYRTTGGFATKGLSRIGDNIVWYAKDFKAAKIRSLFTPKSHVEDQNYRMLEVPSLAISSMSSAQRNGLTILPDDARVFRYDNATGQGGTDEPTPLELNGTIFFPPKNTHWKANYPTGMNRLKQRSAKEMDRACNAVKGAELPFEILDENFEPTGEHVSLSTMHLAKGLEFRAVAVMACDDEILPSQDRIEMLADEADLADVYDTERHLLYVACTRARDYLLVSSGDTPSEFLDDLRM